LFESLFLGLHNLFHNIFGQAIYWSTAKPWTSPKKRSNGLERSKFRHQVQSFVSKFKVSSASLKFRQQVQSFVCVPPWRRVTFKFWEMLKNASEVTLVRKQIFFLKILNFVQIFVECKVSVADGKPQYWEYIT
jgi:hypothetical protein